MMYREFFGRRKLFCEISPLTHKISVLKCRIIRHIKNLLTRNFATEKNDNLLPYTIYKQSSLIRRKLGNVEENNQIYRNSKVYRNCIDTKTGKLLSKELIKTNHAKVMYDTSDIPLVQETSV